MLIRAARHGLAAWAIVMAGAAPAVAHDGTSNAATSGASDVDAAELAAYEKAKSPRSRFTAARALRGEEASEQGLEHLDTDTYPSGGNVLRPLRRAASVLRILEAVPRERAGARVCTRRVLRAHRSYAESWTVGRMRSRCHRKAPWPPSFAPRFARQATSFLTCTEVRHGTC